MTSRLEAAIFCEAMHVTPPSGEFEDWRLMAYKNGMPRVKARSKDEFQLKLAVLGYRLGPEITSGRLIGVDGSVLRKYRIRPDPWPKLLVRVKELLNGWMKHYEILDTESGSRFFEPDSPGWYEFCKWLKGYGLKPVEINGDIEVVDI